MTGNEPRPPLRLTPRPDEDRRPVLITGGAGFIGTNLADRVLSAGTPVTILDNLSRPGVERNLRWLRAAHGGRFVFEFADVRDCAAVERAVAGAGRVIHLAAQVAVTASVSDPLHDFEVNVRGTLNVLSALAALDDPPPLLFTSTNKVYGALDDVDLTSDGRRYEPRDDRIRTGGIAEQRPLSFESPYACSKGAADQYVLDYARTFGLRAVVFRMSCVYGPHQYGTEDQGWLAYFLIRALRGDSITLYGDGQQVRDMLYVDDLVDAVQLAFDRLETTAGRAYNVGGGPHNATSLVEVIELMSQYGPLPEIRFGEWRPGDQRYYVSDTSRFSSLTGWRPATGLADGLPRLRDWLAAVCSATAVDVGPEWVRQPVLPAAVVGDR